MSVNQTGVELGETALAALGNDVRRRIITIIAREPCSTNSIADHFPISRPAISKHLKVLTDAGLIERRSLGTQSIYRLHEEGFVASREWLNRFWPDALTALKSVAEATYPGEPDE